MEIGDTVTVNNQAGVIAGFRRYGLSEYVLVSFDGGEPFMVPVEEVEG
ncbi:hypothetical protein [Tsukamurella tyrosinosolvens]